MATFYHGTAARYADQIKADGLVPPTGHGRGVRLTRSAVEARQHAKAWTAYMLFRDGLASRTQFVDLGDEKRISGCVAVCEIADLPRVRVDGSGTIRAAYVLGVEVKRIVGPIRFPEFGTMDDEVPRPAFFESLEAWEDLTAERVNVPFPRRRVRRS